MKIWAFYILGIVAVVIGLIWIGQGSGYFPYPETSFMIDQSIWEVWGGVAVVAGLLLMAAGRYFGNKQ